MKINKKNLNDIRRLAYLNYVEAEEAQLIDDMNAIMSLIEPLNRVDTQGILPLFHPLDLHQRLRNDEVSEHDCSLSLEELAPFFAKGFYLVPKIIDSGQ